MKQIAYGFSFALAMIGLAAIGFFGRPGRAAADDPAQKAVQKVVAKKAAPLIIQPPVANVQVFVVAAISEQQIEQIVFQKDRNGAGARNRLDLELAALIAEVDHVCTLTEAQKDKLQLMGRGDIKHFFDRYEPFKQKIQLIDQGAHNFLEKWVEIQPELNALRTSARAGLFNDDSLFGKLLSSTLTADQRALRHRAKIESAVNMLERHGIRLREEQRQELIALLKKQTKPFRGSSTPYEYYIMMYQLGRLPEEKLKPLFDDSQWIQVSRALVQAQRLAPSLKQQGLLLDDEEDAEKPDDRPRPFAP